MRAKKKETVIRQLKMVDTALANTSLEGIERIEKICVSVKAVTTKPGIKSGIITILLDILLYYKRNNFNAEGTRKKRSLLRVIKLAGYTLWSLVKIYMLFNPTTKKGINVNS